MAINKVEYKLDSSTNGFASAGDEILISSQNANTIKKDVDDGNTEELNPLQSRYLDKAIAKAGEDNTEYETEGGEDAELSEDGTNDESGKKGNTSIVQAGAQTLFGQAILMANTAMMPSMNTLTAPAIGTAEIAMAGMSIANAALFDTDIGKRMSESSSKDEYAATIDENIETLNADLEELNNNQTLSQLQTKSAQYKDMVENGNKEEAKEILAEIDSLKSELTEGAEAIDVEQITSNNIAAHEFSEYSTSVADFLKEGTPLGVMAAYNTATLAANVFISNAMAGMAWILATPLTAASSATGELMSHIASGMFAQSAVVMGTKTAIEFVCGSRGNSLESKTAEMDTPLAQHDEIADALGELEDAEQATDEISEEPSEGSENIGEDGSNPTSNSPATNSAPTIATASTTSSTVSTASTSSSSSSSNNSNS